MLLATLVVLLQMPFAPAGKLPAQPQAAAPVLVAENTPAKFPPPSSSANPFAPPTQTICSTATKSASSIFRAASRLG